MLGEAPLSNVTGVPGWITNAEENLLIVLASQVPDGSTIVQVGGEFGRGAAALAYALKQRGRENVAVITVDQFPENYQNVGSLEAAFRGNLSQAGLLDYIGTMRGDSASVGRGYEGDLIELLFIDAGHHYLEVVADIEAWFPHLKPSGVLVFHDYAKSPDAHYLHFDVKRAVDEWHASNPDWQRYEGVDSIVYFIGPNAAVPFESEDEIEYEDDNEDETLLVPPPVPANLPIQPDDAPSDDIDWELLEKDYESLSTTEKRAWTKEKNRALALGVWDQPENTDDE